MSKFAVLKLGAVDGLWLKYKVWRPSGLQVICFRSDFTSDCTKELRVKIQKWSKFGVLKFDATEGSQL